MDVDQLRAFCLLAEHKNYRVAAEHLFITQSALTKKIQRLEENIKAPLFERGRQGARLTQVGQTLLNEAQRLVHAFGKFQSLSKSVANGTQGHLSIGFGISTFACAPKYVAHFKQQFPKVNITLNDLHSQLQTDNLLSGELQVSFNRLPVDPPLLSSLLFSEQLVIAVHQDEKIDEKTFWQSLQKHPYLSLNPERGPGLSKQIQRYLHTHKIDLAVTQESDDILTLLALVTARLGFTIVPASAQNISPKDVRFIPLTGEYACWQVGVVWNGALSSPIRDRFIESLPLA